MFGGFPRGRAVGVRRDTHPMRLPHESVLSLHTALRGYPRRSRRTLVTPQHCMFVVVSLRRTLRRTLRIFVRARVSSESVRNRCHDRCRCRCRSRRSLSAVAVPCVWRRPRLPTVRSRLPAARASVVTSSRRACR